MNRIYYFLLIIIFLSGCSFNKNSKFWSTSEKINKEVNLDQKMNSQKERMRRKLEERRQFAEAQAQTQTQTQKNTVAEGSGSVSKPKKKKNNKKRK